jgi:beta-lactamase regulating signal transducer with metallopeptidase domain
MIAQVPDTYLAHALEAALAATLLILLVLAIRKPVARHFGAGIAYALWLLPVARLLLPPLPHQASLFSWLKMPAAAASAPEAAAWTGGHAAALPADAAIAAPPAVFEAPPMVLPAGPEIHAATTPDFLLIAGVAALAIWLTGAVWVLARSLRTHMQFMAIVEREGEPVTGDLASLSLEIAREAGLKRMPRVVTSLISSGPFVTGLFRPAVVLPAWFAQDYTRAEARAALAHELTHVKRGDLWALQASEIFVALMWFNPLAYIARQAFRTDQEAACDADVLRRGHASPHAYGATLVKAVRMQMPARIALTTSLPLTHALKERLKLMSYPAPDTRRRWIGFGAAVLLGTTALVGTASVAAAGENTKKDLKIENGALWLDGEKIDNRQVILLSDPLKGLVPNPPLPPEVHQMTADIAANAAELAEKDVHVKVLKMGKDQNLEEITRLSTELALMGASLGTEAAFESLSMNFSGMSEAEIEAWAEDFEARMEAKAADIEARAEAMEAEIEARSDAMEAHWEAADEARIIAIERRIEADAARIEAEVERLYGDEFEAKVEARTHVIPELVEVCVGLDLADGETRIVERQVADGESVKLACVAGGPEVMRSAKTVAFINANAGLSDEEKAKFLEQSAEGKRTFIMKSADKGQKVTTRVTRRSTSETEAPAAPQAPEAPAAPKELQGADE